MPNLKLRLFLIGAAAMIAGAAGGAASAQDVQTGIVAWQAGDYERAVATWRPLADRGDADAQFNLGQAYRLGRGVPQNPVLAEQWFERAARQRHEQAGASLGLLLFQNGRAREAMPWLQAAAQRGDPRAQYVFGTALFNGDVVRRDLPRAYAMMRAAAAQGFPQAQTQLAEMERQLSPEDRSRGERIAADMPGAAPERMDLAQNDPPSVPQPRDSRPANPSGPGVSYEHPPENGEVTPPPRETGPRPSPRVAPPPRVEVPPRTVTPQPQPQRPATVRGSWQVQLGAFSNAANARRQWNILRRRVSALGALQPSYPRAGALTRLRVGPVGNRAAADRLCAAVRASGEACVPVP